MEQNHTGVGTQLVESWGKYPKQGQKHERKNAGIRLTGEENLLSFSRGGRCGRSAEGSPCAVCFPPPFFPPFSLPPSPRLPQPRRKGNEGGRRQEEREGSYRPGGASEKGGPTKARVMERRVGHIKLPTRKRLDRRDRWIKGLTEERLTYYGSTRDFLA